MELTPGSRWHSAVSEVEVVVVKGPGAAGGELQCGGMAMVPAGGDRTSASPEGATALGKRYVDADDTLEVLCSKGGAGVLAYDGSALTLKGAKPLPASD